MMLGRRRQASIYRPVCARKWRRAAAATAVAIAGATEAVAVDSVTAATEVAETAGAVAIG